MGNDLLLINGVQPRANTLAHGLGAAATGLCTLHCTASSAGLSRPRSNTLVYMQSMQRLVQLFFEGSSKARFRISLTVILVVINANVKYPDGTWS